MKQRILVFAYTVAACRLQIIGADTCTALGKIDA